MALTYSWPGPSLLTSTTDARKDLAGLIETDASGNVRAGIFPANANPLISARSDMNVDIAAFQGVGVQFGGPVLLANDGVAQLPTPLVSPGAGTNFYVIYAKQNESTAPGTDANNNRVFGAALSTVSVAVARGLLPAGAIELGAVQMPSGKTATNQSGVVILSTCQYTAAEGGAVWVRNSTERDAWTPADGAVVFQMDSGTWFQRFGGAWISMIRTATFSLAITGFSDGTVASTTIPTNPITAETNDSTFITARTGTACTVKAGHYVVSIEFEMSSAVFSGRSFAEIAVDGVAIQRSVAPGGIGENLVGASVPVFIPSDGKVISGRIFKTSGGNANITGRLTLMKVG